MTKPMAVFFVGILLTVLFRRNIVRFLLAPAHPLNLAVFRIAVFCTLLAEGFLHSDLDWFGQLLPVLQIGPRWFLTSPPFSLMHGIADLIFIVFAVSTVMAAAGAFGNLSAAVSAFLAFYVLGFPHVFDTPNHLCNHNHHLFWFAVLLACSRSYDSFSLDRLFRRASPAAAGPAYGFPIRAAWLLIGLIYFFPGLWKMLNAGAHWALSDNLKCLIYERWFELGTYAPLFRIDGHPVLYKTAALWVIFFELSFIFMIFHKRLRPVAVIQGLLFHAATYLTLRISFWTLVLCYTAFVDWESLYRRLRSGPQEAAASQGRERRLPFLTCAAAGILIIMVFFAGVFKRDSWPFAVYPSFDRIYDCRVITAEIKAWDADGAELEISEETVHDKLTPPRWQRMLRYALDLPPSKREEYARGLLRALASENPKLDGASRFVFQELKIDTRPGKGGIIERGKSFEILE